MVGKNAFSAMRASLKQYKLSYASWEYATTPENVHLNGVFLADVALLERLGGFDERFALYGWDDSDLYNRMERSARQYVFSKTAVYRNLAFDRDGTQVLSHLPHARSQNPSLETFGICFNRMLSTYVRKRWQSGMRARCDVKASSGERASGENRPWLSKYNCDLHGISESFDSLARQDSKLCARAVEQCAKECDDQIIQDVPASVCTPSDSIAPGYRFQKGSVQSETELANEISLLLKVSSRLFVVEVYHGMGNRLRALASAAAIARLHNFSLVVVWHPDLHANVFIEELFSVWPGSLTTSVSPLNILLGMNEPVRVYDLLRHRTNINLAPGSIYVKSPFVITTDPAVPEHHVKTVLRTQFQVSASVQSLVNKQMSNLRTRTLIGAHIRMLVDQTQDIPGISKETTHSDRGLHAMGDAEEQRRRCHVSYFFPKISAALANYPDSKLYVATDSPMAVDFLSSKFGADRVISTSAETSESCNGSERRKSFCVKLALAESFILSRADVLFTSTWSSASEFIAQISNAEKIEEGCRKVGWNGK